MHTAWILLLATANDEIFQILPPLDVHVRTNDVVQKLREAESSLVIHSVLVVPDVLSY